MNVILTQDVDNLGSEGQIVPVKNGYARNFLIPRGMARQATPTAVKSYEEERRQQSRKIAAKADEARALGAQLSAVTLVVPARMNEDGRLFGTVTTTQLADLLAQQGFQIERRRIAIDEEVRTQGTYTATARLHSDVTATFSFEVVPDVQV